MDQLRLGVIGQITLLMLMLIARSGLQAAEFQPGERLDYTFSYQGIFSGFIKLDIARASFTVTPQPIALGGRQVYRTSLEVTTEPFTKAELIYPFRFRYRSWLEAARQTPVWVQEYKRTDEVEEELLWFNREQGLGLCYQKSRLQTGQAARPPATLLPGLDLDPQEWQLAEGADGQRLPETGVWDYLSMLYRLRFGELPIGESFELPVFNGKRIKTYRIEVTRERLMRAGWDLPAFKLTLFEVRDNQRKGKTVTSIWISDDERRRPLRFRVARAFGIFEGILETDRPLTAGDGEFPEATRRSLELVF